MPATSFASVGTTIPVCELSALLLPVEGPTVGFPEAAIAELKIITATVMKTAITLTKGAFIERRQVRIHAHLRVLNLDASTPESPAVRQAK
jgi:hypothetical protein